MSNPAIRPTLAEPHPERYSYTDAVNGDYPALCGDPDCGPCKASAAAWELAAGLAERRQDRPITDFVWAVDE